MDPWGSLASQLSLLNEMQSNERLDSARGMTPKVDFGLCVSAHMFMVCITT